jgi:hypothetical protein
MSINLGHILTFTSIFCVVVAGWVTQVTTVSANTQRIDRLEVVITELVVANGVVRDADVARQIELTRVLTQLQADVAVLRNNNTNPSGVRP